MDLHVWSSNANLLDEEAHELLALFEIEDVDACSYTLGERFNLARETVRDRELMMLRKQGLALLLELPMAAEDLLVPSLEFDELDGLHLIQINESSAFCLGALQSALQAFELSLQQLIIGLMGARAECCLSLHQDLRPQQRLAELLPDQRVERFRAS